MISDKVNIRMHPYEIAFIASMMGCNYFIGIEVNFDGYNEEMMKEIWDTLKPIMEEKKLIETSFDGSISINRIIHEILLNCIESIRYVFINTVVSDRENEKKMSQSHYFVGESYVVEMRREDMDEDVYEFITSSNVKDMTENLVNKHQIAEVITVGEKRYSINADAFIEINELIEQGKLKEADVKLRALGLKENEGDDIKSILGDDAEVFTSMTVVPINLEHMFDMYTVNFTKTDGKLWMLEEDESIDKIIISSKNSNEANALLAQAFDMEYMGGVKIG